MTRHNEKSYCSKLKDNRNDSKKCWNSTSKVAERTEQLTNEEIITQIYWVKKWVSSKIHALLMSSEHTAIKHS